MELSEGLHWADYVIMSLLLLISLAIGVYHSLTGGRQRTASEFILANRQLQILPTILSLVMSYMSAILLVGFSAEIYEYGSMTAFWFFPAHIVTNVFIAFVIVPWIYPLKLVSVFDYLQIRFNSKGVRYIGSAIGIIHAILYNGVAMFAPSIALESVTGLSVMVSLPVLALVSTAYTALGGMRAVIWTDFFQGIILIAGVLAVVIKASILAGGPQGVFAQSKQHGRLIFDEFSPDPRRRQSALAMTCGYSFSVLLVKGFCQASVQRITATKSQKAAKITVIGNIFLAESIYFLAGYVGLALTAYYASQRCDILASGQISSSNKLLPVFVQTIFKDNVGFSGFFISTLYSGALSSISSSLSGSAANIWEDFLKPQLHGSMGDDREALINRFLVVIVGALSLGVAYICNSLRDTVIKLLTLFFGVCGGPMVGLFLLGGLFRFTNWIGAICGVIASFSLVGWMSAGSMTVPPYTSPLPPMPTDGCSNFNATELSLNGTSPIYQQYNPMNSTLETIYQTSFYYYGFIGCFVTILVGCLVSAIANRISAPLMKSSESIPDKYLIQWRKIACSSKGEGEEEEEFEGEEMLPMRTENRNAQKLNEELLASASDSSPVI